MKEVKKNKKDKKKTDNIKNDKIVKNFILIAYIFILCLAWYDFWNIKSGDEIGFTLLYFYILLPVITLIVTIYIGKDNIKNIFKILLILLFPIRITIGKKFNEGIVELKFRESGEVKEINKDELVSKIKELV